MKHTSKSSRWHFGILGAAILALAGAFLMRSSADLTSFGKTSARPTIQATHAPESQILPINLAKMGAESYDDQPVPESRESLPSAEAKPAVLNTSVAPADDDGTPHHPGDRADPARIIALHGTRPLTVDHPDMAAAIKIQERHPEFMAHPAVVATGIGLNDKAEIALILYTKVEAPELPKSVEGLPIEVFVSGRFDARRWGQQKIEERARPAAVDRTARFNRPVPIGVSTGHPQITAGTISCRLLIGTNYFALSNNHVYANENNATVQSSTSTGDSELQPGPYDGGTDPADKIATLSSFVQLDFSGGVNTVDAAIAATTTGLLGNATPKRSNGDQDGYGVPKTHTIAAAVNQPVQKYGRTTGLTSAYVSALNVKVNVQYDAGRVAYFENQILISKAKFSAGGDSGSLIVVKGGATDRMPVGLLFAGSSTTTIANPIDAVLGSFGATIDGE